MTVTPNLPFTTTCAPWATLSDITEITSEQVAALNQDDLLDDLQSASDILFGLTGMQFPGSCQDTVRPQARMVTLDHGIPIRPLPPIGVAYGYWGSGYSGSDWSRWGWCTCNQEEMPGGHLIPSIDLGVYPLTGIEEVLVDGEPVDPTTYEIQDYRYLVSLADPTLNFANPGWPCFPAGTRVLTDQGLVPIEDVKAGDHVLTHRNRWRRVLRSGQTGISETVTATGRGGTLTSTPDHQVWAAEIAGGRWEERKHLNGKDRRKLGAPGWVEASNLVGHAWATPTRIPRLPDKLPDGWSHEDLPQNFWWFVGRWVGDGWTSAKAPTGKRGGGSNSIMLCCGHHESERVSAALTATGWAWKSHQQTTSTRFRFSNGPLREWLREHFGTSAGTKRIPAWMLSAPDVTRRAFLDGYVSADGYRAPNGGYSATTISRDLAIGLRLLLSGLGYATSLYTRIQAQHVQGRPVTASDAYRVDWSTVLVGASGAQGWVDNDHLWGTVRSVTLDETEVPVFDLDVEDDHSFVADGFVVHNCTQFMDRTPDQVGTFQVAFDYGIPPDRLGVMAACEMAYQFYLVTHPAAQGTVKLPQRVTTLTRQGMSAVILDPQQFLDKGYTGLTLCDRFIQRHNPNHLRRAPVVLNPDLGPTTRRTTWPG